MNTALIAIMPKGITTYGLWKVNIEFVIAIMFPGKFHNVVINSEKPAGMNARPPKLWKMPIELIEFEL
jgi:hypothetical protein